MSLSPLRHAHQQHDEHPSPAPAAVVAQVVTEGKNSNCVESLAAAATVVDNQDETPLEHQQQIVPTSTIIKNDPDDGDADDVDDDKNKVPTIGTGNGAKFTIKDNWMAKYQLLEQYHAQHGNSTVPCHWKENPSLGKWVSKQRTQYKLMQDGKKSQLTAERIMLLERLGFMWKATTCEWGKRYDELVTYKKEHGDTKVPHNYAPLPKLGRWVVNIRWQYKLFQQGARSHLTAERVKKLDDLQFEWKVRDDSGSWMRQYETLKQYHSEHGNTLVPNEYKANPSLGRWVTKQRGQFKQFQEGKASQLTTERIELLQKLGFEWNPFEADWRKCYNQLEEYVKSHGDCKVPFDYKENPFLGKWVSRQRWQYKLHREGKPSQLTAERINQLEQLNFDWRASTSDWAKRYGELEDFIDKKGHSLVPFDYSENRSLGRWVSKQRTQYRLFLQKKPSQLTQERITMLEKLGFEWHANDAKWMAHYVQLEEHLSFVAPGQRPSLPRHSQNQALRRWVEKQRRDPSKLTDKRRKLLDALGVFSLFQDEASPGGEVADKKAPPETAVALADEDTKPAALKNPPPSVDGANMEVDQVSSPARHQLDSEAVAAIDESIPKEEDEGIMPEQQQAEESELDKLVTDAGIKVVDEEPTFSMDV